MWFLYKACAALSGVSFPSLRVVGELRTVNTIRVYGLHRNYNGVHTEPELVTRQGGRPRR